MMKAIKPIGLAMSVLLISACTAASTDPGADGEAHSAQAIEGEGGPGREEREAAAQSPETTATDADRLAERGPVGTVVERPGGPVNRPVPHPLAGGKDEAWPDLAIADLTGTWRLRSISGQVDCALNLGPAGRSRPGPVTSKQLCPHIPDGSTWMYFQGIDQLVFLSGPGQSFWRGQRRGAMEFRAMKDGEMLILSSENQ